MPSLLTAVGLFGLLSTLKKSMFNRSVTFSVIFVNLNNDASKNHWFGTAMYWLRHGARLSLNGNRRTVLLFSGTQTLFVSQNWLSTVLAGALGGSAPAAI